MTLTSPGQAAPRQHSWEGTGFRPDIQGLRAIAVSLVLLSHAGFSWVAGGYVGVDVFFVVSGFLITSLLVQEIFDTGMISLSGFFARRARRILPAATAVTAATAIAAWLWFPITRFEAVMHDALTVIAYVVNYRFVFTETQYLGADALPSPFQQYWSLAVEEQFYLVWPLALLCLLLLVRRRPERALKVGVVFVVGAFVVSLIASILLTASSQPAAYYATHTRVWELAGGAFLALTLPTWRKVPGAVAALCAVVGVAAVIGSGILYDDATAFPGYTALAPVLGTMLLIIAGTAGTRGAGGAATGTRPNPVTRLLSTSPFLFVGKISYSLYLVHWPIIVLGPLMLGVQPSLRLNVVLLVASFAAAQLSFAYVESPIRNARRLKIRNGYGLASGLVCSVLSIAIVLTLLVGVSKVPDEDGPVNLASVAAVSDQPALDRLLRTGLSVRKVPDDLRPALAFVDDDSPKTYQDDCHLGFTETTHADTCVFGDPEGTKTAVLFGDSHAAQWFPALDAIAAQQGWRLISRTKSACTPVDVRVESTQHAGEYTECWEWKQGVFDELDRLKPDLVVLSSVEEAPILGTGTSGGVRDWARGWQATLGRVSAAADKVVTLTDTPRATGERAPDCLAVNTDSAGACLRKAPYAVAGQARRSAAIEAQREAGATVVDTEPWFCVGGQCPLIVDDLLVYRDQHHISTPYAQFLSTLLRQSL
ncbi:MAG: acyltransferase, partial [Nocardioidaceae bacterium]|nr:acyltransferase [Nocardioidaceae bacterium]